MSNFVVEIQAPAIVAAIQQLAAVLSANKSNPGPSALPQTVEEQAVRQQIVPAPIPVQPPYAAPPAPVNPTPAPQQAAPAAPMTSMPPNAPVAAPVGLPSNQTSTYPSNPAPVAAAPTFAMEDLARAASQLMDAGKQQDLLGLLAHFGVQALTQLPPERYGEFATALRQMGAKL